MGTQKQHNNDGDGDNNLVFVEPYANKQAFIEKYRGHKTIFISYVERTLLQAYLSRCVCVIDSKFYSICPLTGEYRIKDSVWTDGRFVWGGEVAYYAGVLGIVTDCTARFIGHAIYQQSRDNTNSPICDNTTVDRYLTFLEKRGKENG